MTNDIRIKQESKEFDSDRSAPDVKPLIEAHQHNRVDCQLCGIVFLDETIRDAHQLNYCSKRITKLSQTSKSNDKSSITSGKRKIHDLTESNDDSTKRLLLSTNMSTSYRRPFNSSLPVKLQNTCQTSKVAAEPLDFSVKKKCQLEKKFENSPINLSMDKFPKAHCSPKMFQCQFCSVRFCSLETLHAHKKNYCGGMYQRKFQLERENPILLNNFDKQSSQTSSSISSKNSKPFLTTLSSLFTCRLCKYQCGSLRNMRSHVKLHFSHDDSCSDQDILVNSKTNPSSILLNTKVLPRCFICSAMFESNEFLLQHLISVHSNVSSCKCLSCQSIFSNIWNLRQHLIRSHTNIRCDDFEPIEHRGRSLKDHQDNVNLILSNDVHQQSLKIKRFACPYCSIKFGSFDTLNQHMTNYCYLRPLIDLKIPFGQTIRNSTDFLSVDSRARSPPPYSSTLISNRH